MKHLNDYQQNKQTEIFNHFGAFFAFSDKQFKEKMQDGIKYTSMGCGMIAPIYNAANLNHALKTIHQEAIQEDIAENGIKKIIHRELANYECQITMDYNDAFDSLKDYGITEDQIQNEWSEFYQKCIDNDWF